jgi:type IV pilus assembly protein PilA
MISTLRKRLRNDEKGFTLIELLVVVIILGILTAIAIPSYLSFRGRSEDAANKANVRSVIPAVESWYADHDTYTGMTATTLQASYDQALDPAMYAITVPSGGASYCVQSPKAAGGTHTFSKDGPAAAIVKADC